MLASYYGWIFGGLGLVGIAAMIALAIFGGPFVGVIAKIAEAILAPIAGVVGQGMAMLMKSEVDGGIDMLATGQRILFVVTVGAVLYGVGIHNTMKWAHAHYWFAQKHYQVVVPHATRKAR